MKYIYTLLFAALIMLGMQSCDKAPQVPPLVILPDSLHEGIYVLNEGNFQSGNATLDFIDVFNNVYYSDVFKQANNRPLGDVLQSMNIINDKIYLVVNNSGKIEVIDKHTFKTISTITGLRSPRYILQISTNKAYITDEYDNSIYVIDLSNNQIIKKIKTPIWTEQMLLAGNQVIVTAPFSDFIFNIDIFKDEITDTLNLSYGPTSIVQQNDTTFWVLCTSYKGQSKSALYKIVLINNKLKLAQSNYFNSDIIPSRLAINSEKSFIYWIASDIYRMNVKDTLLPTTPLIYSNGKTYYGLSYDKKYDELYATDVADFSQSSKVYRYDVKTGNLKGLFKAGIGTNGCYFNY